MGNDPGMSRRECGYRGEVQGSGLGVELCRVLSRLAKVRKIGPYLLYSRKAIISLASLPWFAFGAAGAWWVLNFLPRSKPKTGRIAGAANMNHGPT